MPQSVLYGKFTTLTINQRSPLIESTDFPGLKTLFVRPLPNWPIGVNYPLVPMDIEIEVINKIGSISSTDTIALPATGFSMELQGDGLEVNGYYSPKQGLGTPYPSYQIQAGVVKGENPNTKSRYFWTDTVANSFNITWPTVPSIIPPYSSRLRISATGHGRAVLHCPAGTANKTREWYDFAQCREWVYFGPHMYLWQMNFIAPMFYGTNESFSIEFE